MVEDTIDVVIADDDDASLKLMNVMLRMENGINIVGEAVDGEELIDVVMEKEPHLAIVDISMPKLNGFEAIKKCIESQPDLNVIFVTGIKDYATDAFEIHAIDYIVKPMEPSRLKEALAKAKQQIFASERLKEEQREIQFQQFADQLPKQLMIRNESQYSITLVPLTDIIFIQKEKNGKKSFIHTKEKVYEINDTVSSLLNKVDFRFIQTHRSFIVNVNYIKEIIPSGAVYRIKFKNYEQEAAISKNYVQKVIQFMEKYLTIQKNEQEG
jgi:two-component system, LytTR family, response regulator